MNAFFACLKVHDGGKVSNCCGFGSFSRFAGLSRSYIGEQHILKQLRVVDRLLQFLDFAVHPRRVKLREYEHNAHDCQRNGSKAFHIIFVIHFLHLQKVSVTS